MLIHFGSFRPRSRFVAKQCGSDEIQGFNANVNAKIEFDYHSSLNVIPINLICPLKCKSLTSRKNRKVLQITFSLALPSSLFIKVFLKVPLRRKFSIPFSLQLLKVEVINTYHAKFYIEIPTGRPVILNVKFSFVLPPFLDSKNGREPHRELDLVAPRGI